MRNTERIPRILNLIEQIWKINPDLRLNQIITTANKYNSEYSSEFIFYVEDSALESGLSQLLKDLSDSNK